MIKNVLIRVSTGEEAFRPVIREWGEDAAKALGVPAERVVIKNRTGIKTFIKKIFPFAGRLNRAARQAVEPAVEQDINAPVSVCFVAFVYELSAFQGNIVPIFMDVWTDENIAYLIKRTRKMKLFYVTSRDIFNRVKAAAPDSNVRYMPLSCPDRYFSPEFVKYKSKPVDVIQYGRKNPLLHEWMMRYAGEHKNIDYVYSGEKGSVSTLRGSLGFIEEREKFVELAASAKVSLVSSPGYDVKRTGTDSINFPTVRFYGNAAMGCALIGRYPDNQEFTEMNMRKYCPNVNSYEEFVQSLEQALEKTPAELWQQNREFIVSSLTSVRAEQIVRDLELAARTK